MVIRTTQALAAAFPGSRTSGITSWESAAVDVVVRHGSRADAEALLPVFLAAPEERAELVRVLARHGDTALAERLLAECADAGRLRPGVPGEVLRALGILELENAEELLWTHAADPEDHETGEHAALGLLHLSCTGVREDIAHVLAKHEGQPFFPEFLPALAVKTQDPSWLQRLVTWGERGASTDCSGGLVLGIAMHGQDAAAEFRRLLWNPHWEAEGAGTGTDFWAYAGCRVLGLDLAQLHAEVREATEPADARHRLAVFHRLAKRWAERRWLALTAASEPRESHREMLALLFGWSTPHRDDSLTGWAADLLGHDDPLLAKLYELEAELDLRMHHELEREELAAHPG
ncbi:hypothetical protein LZ318_25080 [Saccharopolyspora indica]|uniref:hypothetical protein n=1 Tax=Saccharopolyspora indica TaxID=1229659 RepID=UPI0022EA74AD|nr:hypothetical protein [Saccharopolyspora indica]MDA3649854.1 hypothetical protein [Saccharopolyspora indica]